jgi:hypothetical protein
MNTLHLAPTAYIDALTLPELNVELVLAASRLVGTRVVRSSLNPEYGYVCRECGARARERELLQHKPECHTGMVAHLLLAIAHAEAALAAPSSPIPAHRKESSTTKGNPSCEPPGAAAQEKRPFLLPKGEGAYGEPWRMEDGDAVDREGNIIVDEQGCVLADPDCGQTLRRIVACVNFCTGFTIPQQPGIAEVAR